MSTLRLERLEELAIVRLDKARGNAIDEALVDDLATAVREVASDTGVRGVLLASGHPKLFCPGLDLVALSGYDRPAMERFMLRFGAVVTELYALRKPLVAAVSGHAVAGGCILALTADLRVLKRGAQIGLNEVKVGVPLPWSVTVLLRATVAPPALCRVALLGRNFADAEALAAGLADAVVEPDAFDAACLAVLRELAEKDAAALGTTKAYLRADALAAMRAHERDRISDFLDGWFSEATQARIRQTAAALGGRA
jgi:enoyl-CoA hydratase/carnithine racemase